jgi:hypothetical protein
MLNLGPATQHLLSLCHAHDAHVQTALVEALIIMVAPHVVCSSLVLDPERTQALHLPKSFFLWHLPLLACLLLATVLGADVRLGVPVHLIARWNRATHPEGY